MSVKNNAQPKKPKKDVRKLTQRVSDDHLFALHTEGKKGKALAKSINKLPKEATEVAAKNRLDALKMRDAMPAPGGGVAPVTPVDPLTTNWVPMGPLAVPNGQTYGGARVLISGRVTAIAPHPVDVNTIYIGTSRGGVWKSGDGGVNWTPKSDHESSLAIGALAVAESNPDVLYAGTGEGNVQYYSTVYPTNSAPGVYLGVGILKSINGGNTWTLQADALLTGKSFYRIAVLPSNDQVAFAATSNGLCRTTDGSTWAAVTGGGLPAITATVIACTDVIIDRADATGNTVYAAFWRSGIYKSTNAQAANPTWTQITTGIPAANTMSRISLAQSVSMPSKIFALIASSGDAFLGVYQTTDATGTNWASIISAGVSLYGAFTNDIAVDPTTPNVIYMSGVELYKGVFSAGSWTVTNIGQSIHPDSHCFGFNPSNSSIIYSGNDGGVYKSADGGTNWDDTMNEGLCLMQYEAMDDHPSSDAMVIGGVQDNGTQMWRNSPVFYHAADGDGGYCNFSPVNPRNVVHSYYSESFERSTSGGKFGTWADAASGINGAGLFYPPAAISPTSERMAAGTDRINIDDTQGTGGWPGTGVTLPGITGKVSAVSFYSETLIYAASTTGKVYKVELVAGVWTATALHAAPLPSGWIWDISALPGDPNTIIVAFSGFGLEHVWQGVIVAGVTTWTAISGSGPSALPDIPMYALAFRNASEFYVGTDVGVFRTTNGGTSWSNFNQGLPNTAVYDLRYNDTVALLRAGTHGRGLWEIKVDAGPSTCDLYVRDNLMHTGRANSGGSMVAGYEDQLNHVNLGDNLYFWQCADIKVDSPNPSFQLSAPATYFDFETRLEHRDPEKGNTNRVYVQVHNRGPQNATNVWVKIMYASAAAGLPDLPADFWATFPNSAGDANWTPVGAAQQIPLIEPLKPMVLQWDWKPPVTASTHSCMLVVIDSVSDPIPNANKITNIGTLITNEKHVGLRNLHVVDMLPDEPRIVDFGFYGTPQWVYRFRPLRLPIPRDIQFDMLLPKNISEKLAQYKNLKGVKVTKLSKDFLKKFYFQLQKREFRDKKYIQHIEQTFDRTRSFRFDPGSKEFVFPEFKLPKGGLKTLMVFTPLTAFKESRNMTIAQETAKGEIVGGSTFVFRVARKPK